MKKLLLVSLGGVLISAILLSACSKSPNKTFQTENSAGPGQVAVASDSPVDMRIKWTTGKKYPMHIELTQASKTDLPNQAQPVVQELKLTQDFSFSPLKELDNGGHQLELTFENLVIDVSQGGKTVLSFDSAKGHEQEADNPVAPMLRSVIGAHIEYFTDANGGFQKMEGVDELRRRAITNAKQQEQGLFDGMFNEDTLQQYASFADTMPNHPVRIGDHWRVHKDVTSRIGVLNVDVKYTFKNWQQIGQRNCAHVEAVGDLSTKSVSATGGAAVEIKKGNISGEFWYDPVLGMIVAANNNMNLALKVTTRTDTMTSQFTQNSRVALVDPE